MENKQLSLEDKIKPYLILAKVLDKQKRDSELIGVIFQQMLNQVKFQDLGSDIIEGEVQEESSPIPLSHLVEKINMSSLETIKETLEEAEKSFVKQ